MTDKPRGRLLSLTAVLFAILAVESIQALQAVG